MPQLPLTAPNCPPPLVIQVPQDPAGHEIQEAVQVGARVGVWGLGAIQVGARVGVWGLGAIQVGVRVGV